MFAEFTTSIMHYLGNFLDKQVVKCIHAMLMKKAAVLDEQRPLLKAEPTLLWFEIKSQLSVDKNNRRTHLKTSI